MGRRSDLQHGAGLILLLLVVTPVIARYDETTCKRTLAASPEWRPLRVKFQSSGAAMLSPSTATIRNTILPQLGNYLSKALSVRDYTDALRMDRVCASERFGLCTLAGGGSRCWHQLVNPDFLEALDVYDCPVEAKHASDCALSNRQPAGKLFMSDVDLLIFVTLEPCAVGAYGIACSQSACGRPNVGHVNLCRISPDMSDHQWTVLLLHETLHVLGFHVGDWMKHWINEDGTLQLDPSKRVDLLFEIDRTSTPELKILQSMPIVQIVEKQITVLSIPHNVVKSIESRGLGGEKCNCPIDGTPPTGESLSKCLLHRDGLRDCVFVVVSPAVVRETQSYYACKDVVGMELENRLGHDGGEIVPSGRTLFNSHWKYKNIQPEIMNGYSDKRPAFVSPMTFALLEDSGWYKVNYEEAVTRLFKEIMHGYQAGCDFLLEKCPTNSKLFISNDEHNPRDETCAPDTLRVVYETLETPESANDLEHDLMEYCHSYLDKDVWCSEFWDPFKDDNVRQTNHNYAVRCLLKAGRQPDCFGIRCTANNSYFVYADTGSAPVHECTQAGRAMVKHKSGRRTRIYCADPDIVCAKLWYPHIPTSDINIRPDYLAKEEKLLIEEPNPDQGGLASSAHTGGNVQRIIRSIKPT